MTGTLMHEINPKTDASLSVNEEQVEVIDTTGFADKVKAVDGYIEYALSNKKYSRNSTKLKAETLVMASMENNFDLPFLMAAAHQESCFGATPRARRTNSVFSVGSYDNGKNYNVYSDPNESVEDYIRLINENYLVNGKELTDLLVHGNFKNGAGKRYAQDAKYEAKIKSLRNSIIRKYPELT